MNDKQSEPVTVCYNSEGKYDTTNRQFQGIPSIEVTHSGKLWAGWYAGGINEGPDNYVIIMSSDDGGGNWTEPIAVIDPPGNTRAFDPVLWHDQLGRMWWFWSQSYSLNYSSIHDGSAVVWGIYTENPDAQKPIFSAPIKIGNGVMMNKPVVLSSGEWALPIAIWKYRDKSFMGNNSELDNERFSRMIISDDHGKTFRLQGYADVPHRCFDEHIIIELKNGRLWMLVRTEYGIGQSFSSDLGKTWTLGEDSGLGGPNSRFSLIRLSSGNLLLINHADISPAEGIKEFLKGRTWRTRSHLTAFISDDDGRTWKGGLLLDERDGVSYPDAVEDKAGTINVIYDYQRHKEGSIFMASFREEDVLAGECISEGAVLKRLINSTGGIKNEANRNQTNVM